MWFATKEHWNRTFRYVRIMWTVNTTLQMCANEYKRTPKCRHMNTRVQTYSELQTFIHTHTHTNKYDLNIFLCLFFPIVVVVFIRRFPHFTPLNWPKPVVYANTFVHTNTIRSVVSAFVWRNECALRICVSPTMSVSLVFSVCPFVRLSARVCVCALFSLFVSYFCFEHVVFDPYE